MEKIVAMDIKGDMRSEVIKNIRSFCTIHKGPLLVNQLMRK